MKNLLLLASTMLIIATTSLYCMDPLKQKVLEIYKSDQSKFKRVQSINDTTLAISIGFFRSSFTEDNVSKPEWENELMTLINNTKSISTTASQGTKTIKFSETTVCAVTPVMDGHNLIEVQSTLDKTMLEQFLSQ